MSEERLGIDVEVNVSGQEDLTDTARQLDDVADAQDRVANATQRRQRRARGQRGQERLEEAYTEASRYSLDDPAVPIGPFQRSTKAETIRRRAARLAGDEDKVLDARYAALKAQENRAKAEAYIARGGQPEQRPARERRGPFQEENEAYAALERAEAQGDQARVMDARLRVQRALAASHRARKDLFVGPPAPPTNQQDEGDDPLGVAAMILIGRGFGPLGRGLRYLVSGRRGGALQRLFGGRGPGGGGGGFGGGGGGGGGAGDPSGGGGMNMAGFLASTGLSSGQLLAIGIAGALIGIYALGKGLRALVREIEQSSKLINSYSSARLLMGARPGDVTALTSMGFTPEQATSTARSLRDRLATDQIAMLAASQLGVAPQIPRIYGSVNEAALLTDVIDRLRRVRDLEERRRLAAMLGREDLLELSMVSSRVFERMKDDAKVYKRAFEDESYVQDSRDLKANTDRVRQGFDALKVTAFKPMIPALSELEEKFADFERDLAELGNTDWIQKMMRDRFSVLGRAMTPWWLQTGNVMENLQYWLGFKRDAPPGSDPTQGSSHPAAHLPPGIYGGGERLRGALPPGLRGEALRRAIEENASIGGAFAL